MGEVAAWPIDVIQVTFATPGIAPVVRGCGFASYCVEVMAPQATQIPGTEIFWNRCGETMADEG